MKYLIVYITFLLVANFSFAQERTNNDESKVPAYSLPDPLVCLDGTKVTTAGQWEKKRRPEVLELFASQMYGRTPKEKIKVIHTTLSENPDFMDGKATCKQVKFTFTNGTKNVEAILLLVLPNRPKGKVPVFVAYNFRGNPSVHPDPSIAFSPYLTPNVTPEHLRWDNTYWVRGHNAERCCLDLLIDRGYGLATMFYQDIYSDKAGNDQYSVVSLFPDYSPGPKKPDEWQAIGAWAWGTSRIVDYLVTQKRVDRNKIITMGHSRHGKAALWAGAQDKRFAIVISNNSGCGGAALSKRFFGESVGSMTRGFPHWLCPAFNQYANNEANMPFDQHFLITLIAPRHVYIASAEEDTWADPKGEFLAGYHAGPIFELYGLKGLGTAVMPPVNQPIMNDIGYHIREGVHEVTEFDWNRYMDFADKHLK